ncbi:MAG TPA: sugar ABC transporter ATP-binding protein [Solirubrobacterales bacterium]|nr:sugar ABC transporter ATP-binding protein [Solirubrobacterales bacterium]
MSAAAAPAAADRSAPPFLELRDLVREFPGVRAVDHASLSIWPGEIVGLVGKNGAGKSTLIGIADGAVSPDSGAILIDGEEVTMRSPRAAITHGIAVVPQETATVSNLSVAENIRLGLGYPKRFGTFVDGRRLRARTREILQRLNVDVDPRRLVGELTAVEQRMVMIARGIAADARLLVLDEPSAALTPDEVDNQLHPMLRSLRDGGMAVLYVTHRLNEIFAVTDRVVVMRGGQVVSEHETATIDTPSLVEAITGAPVDTAGGRADGMRPATATRPPPGEELLRVESLSRDEAVRNVSFSLRAGEILGIAGLVGAGRTELVRLVYGADRATAGSIYVRGEQVDIRSPRQALRRGIALLPEDRRHQGLVRDFSIRDNITLPVLPRLRVRRGVPSPSAKAEREVARRWMRDLGVAAVDEDQRSAELSGGNQQKTIVGRWLEFGADVLIFDEPTLGIDVQGKRDVYRLLDSLAGQGKGVIVISSEFVDLCEVAHRILVMRQGEMVAELAAEGVTERVILDHCFDSTAT